MVYTWLLVHKSHHILYLISEDNWLASGPRDSPIYCSSWRTCIHDILQLVSFIKQGRFSINITYHNNMTCKPWRPFSFSEGSWKGLQFLCFLSFSFMQANLLLIGGSSRDLSYTSAGSNTESWSIGSSWLSSLWKSEPKVSTVGESGSSSIWNFLDLLKTTSSWKVTSQLTYSWVG